MQQQAKWQGGWPVPLPLWQPQQMAQLALHCSLWPPLQQEVRQCVPMDPAQALQSPHKPQLCLQHSSLLRPLLHQPQEGHPLPLHLLLRPLPWALSPLPLPSSSIKHSTGSLDL